MYQLPVTFLLDSVKFQLDQDGELVFMDEGEFSMDVWEALPKKELHEQD